MSEKAVQTSLPFFKIFDLAFFAPGLFITIHLGFFYLEDLRALNFDLATTGGAVFAVISAIGIIYAVGVANFAMSRFILNPLEDLIESSRPEKPVRATFPMQFDEKTRAELILYFWYLRSTTHALGVAFLISGGILFLQPRTVSNTMLILAEWVSAYFLFRLSKDYKWNLDHSDASTSSGDERGVPA